MHIRVADKKLGECNIDINVPIEKQAEYIIKSLCCLQILCMYSTENPQKFSEFISIIRETTEKAEALYKDSPQSGEELDGTEDFDF